MPIAKMRFINIIVALQQNLNTLNDMDMKVFRTTVCCILLLVAPSDAFSQRVEPIAYGNMDSWVVRNIKESAIIGGKKKTIYAIGPNTTINSNTPYKNMGGSPWGTSNVMAKVMGIVKTNNSVFRDIHPGHGHCAKMTTHIETCKALGIINIKVLAAGSIYLGDMKEPITGTKDGPKNVNWGIRFNKRPKALRYDYKIAAPGTKYRIKETGFSSKTTVPGQDYCITVLYLQKRTEDKKGNITAKRVGTLVVKYGKSTNWVNGATYEILYGDIRKNPHYNAATMGLRSCDYARNSKGKSVPVRETGWADADETPTHLILQFSSSHGGAYIGTPGNTFWVDNVALVY